MTWFLSDRLRLYSLIFLAVYWGPGPFIEPPGVSNAVSVLLICSGIFLFIQYIEAATKILFKDDRREGYQAVYGATVAAFGIAYQGGATLLWNYLGQPEAWIGTAGMSFGRALVGIGMFMMGMSHETIKVGGRYPKGFWRAIVVMLAIIAAFIAGTHFAAP